MNPAAAAPVGAEGDPAAALLDPWLDANHKGWPHLAPPLRRSQVGLQGWRVLDGDLPLDPWDTPYQYALTPGSGGQPFALYSLGADGKLGGEGNDADVGYVPVR